MSGWGFDCVAAKAHALRAAGKTRDAEDLERGVKRKTSKALLAMGRSDAGAALASLQEAVAERDNDLPRARFDPRFRALRRDPRFAEIWEKLGM
jgi:hypothetical protein